MTVASSVDKPSPVTRWWGTLRDYLELIRFSHTIFAMPFALLSLAWAMKLPATGIRAIAWLALLGVVICMVAARSFAMSINRLVDARFDAMNPRTAGRHLPSGRLDTRGVIFFAVACGLIFVAGTVCFFPNRLPLFLSLPVLAFLGGYSLAKRFTAFVHFWLGAALGLAPLCVWVAVRGETVLEQPSELWPALLLGLGVSFWVAGFDIIYATQDAQVDRKLGLLSLPARIGIHKALRGAAVCHALMLVPFSLIPWLSPELGLGVVYFIGIAIIAGLLLYEHSVISPTKLERVNVAFFQANAVISLVMLVAGAADAWLTN